MAAAAAETTTALALKPLGAKGAAFTFAPGASKLWACSPDGTVVAVDAATGEAAPKTTEVTGEPVCLAVTHSGASLAVGMTSGKVELNDLPACDFDDFLARTTSPVRDVCFSASDEWAAVASDDLEVLLVEVASRTVTQLKGKGAHDGGGRSVCFDPRGEFLVSLGADGQACVWDVQSKACVWSKRVLERSASSDPHLVVPRAAWRPDGELLALPGSRQPLLVERGTWRVVTPAPAAAAASELAHSNDTSVLAWAPDGKVLASAGLDKRVLLWAAGAKGALRATHVYTGPAGSQAGGDGEEGSDAGLCVRNLVWTADRTLALLTTDGSFAFQAVPASAAVVVSSEEEEEQKGAEGEASGVQAATTRSPPPKEAAASDAGPASDEESTSSGSTSKSEKKKKKRKEKAKAAAASLLDDEASVGTGKGGDADEKSEAMAEDATQEEHPPEEEDEDGMEEDGMEESSRAGRMVEVPDMQGPFLPSSSPIDAVKRFLVWSPVGSIVSQNLGDHHAIEVEFADGSRRPVRFTDHYGFVMGSLAEDGAIFASVALGSEDGAGGGAGLDDEERSTVFFRPFSNYSQKSQWLYTLPQGESALCVAVGSRWAAVATSRQWIRLFTFSGLQDGVVALPGPVVTMVGRGDLLAVFYHGGSPLLLGGAGGGASASSSQCLHFQLLDVRRSAVVASGPLALSPRALLQWCGFSNLDILHVMDSDGVVYGLLKGFGWHWAPLLETQRLKRNKLDAFWPVGVHGGSLMCTLLKGGDEHPTTYPKPLVTSLPFKLPLVGAGGAGSAGDQALLRLEETRLLSRAFLNQKAHQQEALASEGLEEPALEEALLRDQATLDAHLIKMLQMAAANENGERMVEVAEQLHLQKSLELAIRVADHYSLPQVAGKISDLLSARFPPVYEEEEVEDLGAFAPSPLPGPMQQARRAGLLGKALGRGAGNNGSSASALEAEAEADGERSVAAADDGDGSLMVDGNPDESSQQEEAAPAPTLKLRTDGGAKAKAGAGAGGGASASAAARNPFALKKDQANGKGGEKRPRGIAESLGSLLGSPSPKKPVLQKTSSFARSASEIRSKKKHDRRV